MLELKKKFVWHMSGHYWEKAFDKMYDISTSFKNVHQRFLDKNKPKRTGRFVDKQN